MRPLKLAVQLGVQVVILHHHAPMSGHAMPPYLCHAMPCHAMPCHAMPCHAKLICAQTMPCHAASETCHAMANSIAKAATALHAPSVSPTHRGALLPRGAANLQHPLQHCSHLPQVLAVVLITRCHVCSAKLVVLCKQARCAAAAKQPLLLGQPAEMCIEAAGLATVQLHRL